MPKKEQFYTVKAQYCVEETYRVKAASRDDAIENYSSDGEVIDRDEESGSEYQLVSVQAENDTEQRAFSVLLAYPHQNDNGEPETYYAHVWAANKTVAVQRARETAWNANEGSIGQDEFYPLLVLSGHIEAEVK